MNDRLDLCDAAISGISIPLSCRSLNQRIGSEALRGLLFSALFTILFSVFPLFASDFYKWTDERGTVHFSNSLSEVPARFRDQVEGGDFKKKKQREDVSEPPGARSDGDPQKEDLKTSSSIEKPLVVPTPKRRSIAYKDNEGSSRRVIINVTFHDRVTVPMVFDTGAFETIVFPELAEKLGLFDRDRPKLQVVAGGIGGTAPAIRTIVDSMRVGDFRSDFVPITIIDRLSEAFEGIIGLDFISDYSVRIDPKNKVVLFEEMDSETIFYGGHDETWWRKYFAEFDFYRKAWKERIDDLERSLQEEVMTFSAQKARIREEVSLAKYYQRESEKMFDRLNRYATEHSVPVHWRRAKR